MATNTPATQTDNAPDRGIQSGVSNYSPAQRDRLRAVQNLGEASDADLDVLFAVAERSGLDPMLKEIYLVGRKTKTGGYRGEPERWETVWTVQTGIDGFRKVTHRYAASKDTHVSISRPTFYDDEGRPHPFWSKKYGEHPEAAEITVTVGESSSTHIVTWDEYVQTKAEYRNGRKTGEQVPNSMWQQYGPTMLAKCFTGDTEVLTADGFIRLDQFDGQKVAQVTDSGLELVNAAYLAQGYNGDMVTSNADMLNFKVTPNHDMVTTIGKVEAGAMYHTTTTRGPWKIPLTHYGSGTDNPEWNDDDLRLAGYIIADANIDGNNATIEVSRPYKIEELDNLNAARTYVRHSRGAVAMRGEREIRSNFDKNGYTFPLDRVSPLIDRDKSINVPTALSLSPRQARVLVDAWQLFDGHTNKTTRVRRVYTSRNDHLRALETIAVHAGYTVNVARERTDIEGADTNYCLTISEANPVTVVKPHQNRPGVAIEPNESGKVYCVTVPSGKIIVRRNGFSMVCGNCAEAGAHRRVCPLTSGMYVPEELQGNRASYQAHARRLDDRPETTRQRDDDTAADLAALTQASTANDMNLADTLTKQQPQAQPQQAQAPAQPQQQEQAQPQGRKYPWPPRLDTGDSDEDQRLHAIIENEIKAAKTRDDLQKLYDEFNETFSDLHNETFTAALNARSEDIATGNQSPQG